MYYAIINDCSKRVIAMTIDRERAIEMKDNYHTKCHNVSIAKCGDMEYIEFHCGSKMFVDFVNKNDKQYVKYNII